MTELAGNRNVTEALARWLAGGRCKIGQLAVESSGTKFELRHVDEMDRADLETHRGTIAARHLANLDDADRFRPLKTAPNLRHGWRLILRDVDELRVALDYFYPAMLGVALSHERGELRSVPLRETLGRQTGMYRVTQKITDEQARSLIDSFCAGCLKCRLWDARVPEQTAEEFPLLCHEACNLLVAEARKVVKAK